MATEYTIKAKTTDADSKTTTKSFSKIDQEPTTSIVKRFVNNYAALTDYSIKSGQKITTEDVDLDS